MTQRAQVMFSAEDFEVADLDAPAWSQADQLMIAKYWNGEAAPEGRHSLTRLLWSSEYFYLRFDCRQTEPPFVNAAHQTTEKTMQLWEHDVCELFIAPDARNRRRYFEFEIAPTGEWLDLIVDWMKDEPRDWEYKSAMEASARIEPDEVTMAMKIPWTAFGKKPEPGDVWLGNLFRCVGEEPDRGYLAWSPTMTKTPQFHVPEKFGEFAFRK
jgi:hypothetical protein